MCEADRIIKGELVCPMSENELKECPAFHYDDCSCKSEVSRLTQLLSQERDDFRKKETEWMVEKVNKYADAKRLIEWLEGNKPANTAFTEGPERQVAYAIETKISKISTSPVPMYEAKIKQLEATNKRYRDGLEKIIETRKRTDPCAKLILMGRIAREALEGTGDE